MALLAKKKRTEWSLSFVGRKHQDGGFGRVSLCRIPATLSTLWARRIPSDNFGVQVQAHWVPRCDTGAGEGHEWLRSSLLYWIVARIRKETIVVEVR